LTNGYELEKYKGIQIFVSTSGLFNADVNEKEVVDQTLKGLKEKLDGQIKTDLSFKPIEAIEASSGNRVKITSVDRESLNHSSIYIWVSYPGTERGYQHRGKVPLGDYWKTQKYTYYYKATPENLEILEKIISIQGKIAELEDSIRKLKTTYTSPIHRENVGA
jgi:hypothetical protein